MEDTQNCLYNIYNQCNTKNLIINFDKTTILNEFNRKNAEVPCDLYFNGVAIQLCEEVKYVGLLIQKDHKCDSHINTISS